tara:strand:+ start:2648 stop:4453 length:1806 start_codon:yes stop_codon:yes gene_type:complete
MISTLLIANRGEIACRIIRTARRLGIRTVAVYSAADRGALHTLLADDAVPLLIDGDPRYTASDTYLNQSLIMQVAHDCRADAVHPGYGFLSENATFAQAVADAGMKFVGPSAAAIEAMGSKARAKQLMSEAGVPLLPGYHGADQSDQVLKTQAEQMGYPILIKAVAGGGGRGLRIVESSEQFADALTAVKREAISAFGDDRVLLERYLARARHVEIQVFADQQGQCVHLYERDCSVQRRHQKLIEEAPAPGLTEATRQAMGDAAVRAAQAIDYTGAGTVEFLYQDGEFYFLEMNTRLQVEHPVTEMITGLDLVEWQLRVAAGEPLPLPQAQIPCNGWAIEARINAESGAPDFLPSTGLIQQLAWPSGEGIRVDAGFRSGDRISVYYDSLLGKVIAHGASRNQAAARLANALTRLQVLGISHNAGYLGAVVDTDAFRRGDVQTGFVVDHQAEIAESVERRQALCVSTRFAESSASSASSGYSTNWHMLTAWRSAHTPFSRQHHITALFSDGPLSPACDPATLTGSGAQQHGQQQIKAPLPGRVISVLVANGDAVAAGQALLIMEAMKMEHTLRATADGSVTLVHCAEGDMVQPDQLMMEFAD